MLFLREVWTNIRDYFRHGPRPKADPKHSAEHSIARGLTEAARDKR